LAILNNLAERRKIMFYFYGEWKDRGVDDKGRIYPPSVFREELAECIFTPDNGNIRIYREKGKLPFSKVYPVKADKEGRILIPIQLREGWPGKVIEFIGEGEYLELKRM